MDSRIKVTICCLTYNHELYIRDAINSFLKQKANFNFEILIFDDCSQDTTRDIISDFQLDNPGVIRVLFPEENTFSKGRTVFYDLIIEANGEYIAFCEGDDYWISDCKLQDQVSYLESNSNVDLCFHPSYNLLNNEVVDSKYGYYGNEVKVLDSKSIIKSSSGYMPMAAIVARRKVFINFFDKSPDFFSHNLWHTTIQILGSINGGAGYLPNYSAIYRTMHLGSWSLNNNLSIESKVKNIESFLVRNRRLKIILSNKNASSFNYAFLKHIVSFVLKEKVSLLIKLRMLKKFFI